MGMSKDVSTPVHAVIWDIFLPTCTYLVLFRMTGYYQNDIWCFFNDQHGAATQTLPMVFLEPHSISC